MQPESGVRTLILSRRRRGLDLRPGGVHRRLVLVHEIGMLVPADGLGDVEAGEEVGGPMVPLRVRPALARAGEQVFALAGVDDGETATRLLAEVDVVAAHGRK